MYKILRADKAEDQLSDIIYYIADDSGRIDIALRYLHKIEEANNRLQELSNSGNIPVKLIFLASNHLVLLYCRKIRRLLNIV